jgi:hypothetical protein
MLMRTIFFLLFSALLFASCEGFFSTTVKADPPEYDPQLVFHLLMTDKDTDIRLTLSRSYGLLEPVRDEEKWYISGATVEWWQGGQKVLTLMPLPGDSAFVYTGKLAQPLKPGDQCEVRVTHPDFPAVRAVQTMPAAFSVDSVRVRKLNSKDPYAYQYQVDVPLNDQAGTENYYEFQVYQRRYSTASYIDPVTGALVVDTFEVRDYLVYFDEFLDRNTLAGTGQSALISDQLFDGQAYKFQVKFTPSSYSSSDSMPLFHVRVRSMTKDYYQWSRSYYQRYENEFEIFSEPVTVLNNVENGLGVFGLATEKLYLVR